MITPEETEELVLEMIDVIDDLIDGKVSLNALIAHARSLIPKLVKAFRRDPVKVAARREKKLADPNSWLSKRLARKAEKERWKRIEDAG